MRSRLPSSAAAALAGLVLLALSACGGAAGDGTPSSATVVDRGPFGGLVPGEAAPELAGTGEWFNSSALTLAALREEGRIVLIDFWTYSCVNCLRTLPFLNDWHAKYADLGLTIIGVHTPEFRFEESAENVRRAILEGGIGYPVVQDNQRLTWRAFDNRVWPAKYLVGADGLVFYRHFGEGRYDETEEAIRAALEAAGRDLSGVRPGGLVAPALAGELSRMTRELYFGYERNYSSTGVYAAQAEYYEQADTVIDFTDPGPPRRPNVWYAQGLWNNADEALVLLQDSATFDDYVTFEFTARSVNPVLSPPLSGPALVLVELDGAPLRPEEAGPDVDWDAEGRSLVRVDRPGMYRVVELSEVDTRVITLSARERGLSIYSVTFGSYEEGP